MTRPILVALKRYASVPDYPGELELSDLVSRGEIDGYTDAALDRPESAAIRFCEGKYHYDNMDRFGSYLDGYTRAYRNRKERADAE